MTTTPNTQPERGPINGGKTTGNWIIQQPSRRARVGMRIHDAASRVADLLLAWAEGFLSLTAVLEQVVDSLDAIRKQLAEGGAA